jgi:protein-S-isoprenylcysteine O-methyltransferase Ste14
MELIFWTSVGLSIVAVTVVAILVVQFYNPKPLSMIPSLIGAFVMLLFLFALRLLKNGNRTIEEDIPGKDEPTGNAKIIDSKEVAKEDDDFTFSERPFNSYELYN